MALIKMGDGPLDVCVWGGGGGGGGGLHTCVLYKIYCFFPVIHIIYKAQSNTNLWTIQTYVNNLNK